MGGHTAPRNRKRAKHAYYLNIAKRGCAAKARAEIDTLVATVARHPEHATHLDHVLKGRIPAPAYAADFAKALSAHVLRDEPRTFGCALQLASAMNRQPAVANLVFEMCLRWRRHQEGL
jgi:hypothetical protein